MKAGKTLSSLEEKVNTEKQLAQMAGEDNAIEKKRKRDRRREIDGWQRDFSCSFS